MRLYTIHFSLLCLLLSKSVLYSPRKRTNYEISIADFLMKIIKKFTFDSAHQLWNDEWTKEENLNVYGKCTNLHGHTYHLSVVVSGEDGESGMVMNFTDLKRIVKENVISRYDHCYLNDLEEFEGRPTTSENIAQIIFNKLTPIIAAYPGVRLEEIRLSETPTSEAIVSSATN